MSKKTRKSSRARCNNWRYWKKRAQPSPVEFERELEDGTIEKVANRVRRREIIHWHRQQTALKASNQQARRNRLALVRVKIKKMIHAQYKHLRVLGRLG